MNLLFNTVSHRDEEMKERWFDATSRNILLFFLPILIVWQTFLICYTLTQMIDQFVQKYFCPVQVVAETDIDPFYDSHDKEDEIYSDIVDEATDFVLECIKLVTYWLGLFIVINIVYNTVFILLFLMLSTFFLISSFMETPVFNRKHVGKTFDDRIQNYSKIILMVFEFVVIVIAIVALVRIFIKMSEITS